MTTRVTKDDSPFRALLPIFATREYLSLQSKEYGWITNDKFVVPWFVRRGPAFRRLTFTQAAIICAADPGVEAERMFLEDVKELARDPLAVDVIAPPLNHVHFRVMPREAVGVQFGSYQIDLSHSEDELFAGMHGKHRNVVRKAERQGVEIHFGAHYRMKCVHLFRTTMKREDMHCPQDSYFESLADGLGEHLEFVIATRDDEVQAAAMIPWNEHGGYYLWGGTVATPVTGAANLMHWQIMRRLKSQSVKMYDFVGARLKTEPGSKLEGIQRFKERFGAVLSTGYLWKAPVTYKYYVHETLKKLSGRRDIIDQELQKERHSPHV